MNEADDKFKVKINYAKQSFEDVNSNPYEIAVAASKYARALNDKMRKFYGSEVDIQPRNLAMKKMQNGNVELVYIEEEDNNNTVEEL